MSLDAIKRVAESGKEVNRSNVRDAIQATKLKTLQGEVSFDEHGDMLYKVVSVFQYRHDPNIRTTTSSISRSTRASRRRARDRDAARTISQSRIKSHLAGAELEVLT